MHTLTNKHICTIKTCTLLHINTYVLLRHAAKMNKFKFYGSGNIALGLLFIAAHCNIISPSWQRSKNWAAE